ncbi:MAG: hypothetical protein NC212_03675 [Staphylococcus sp.]|nr:hypothetical protein [Staphylococcus sp.]
MSPIKLTPAAITLLLVSGCGASKDNVIHDNTPSAEIIAAPVTVRGGRTPAAIVPARIYKTNGDYADKVPVMLNADRNTLVSYPAPTDLRTGLPVKLTDGFLLDNRGVGVNTAFTRWSYREYEALAAPPSPAEIMANILPEARVTEIYEMPFASGTPDAAARCDSLIRAGLPGCRPLSTGTASYHD